MAFRADLILYNATVITGMSSSPFHGAVAIKGGRILAVGREEELANLKGLGTQTFDCEGKALVPGFIDAHCHLLGYAQSLASIDLSKADSIEAIKHLVRQRAEETPPGTWVTGIGYHDFLLKEKRHPNRHDLDEAAPQHPVRLVHRSGHAQVFNSLGLKLLGVTIETPEPPGGFIDREPETGEPNGVLFNMGEFIRERLPPLDAEEMERVLTQAQKQLLGWGITTVYDASATNGVEQWELFKRLSESGRLLCRVGLMIGTQAIPDFAARGLAQGDGGERLRLGPVKIVLEETTGQLHPSPEELHSLILKASSKGFGVAIHAVEGNPLEIAVSVFEKLGAERPKILRIEHASLCPEALAHRIQKAGITIVAQPAFLHYNGDRYLDSIPHEMQRDLYPIARFLQKGITVAASSDAPVVPPHPLAGIYAAVTRKTVSGRTVAEQHAISPLEALRLYTSNAATACLENDKGTLERGKLADLVLLSSNPLEIPPDELKQVEVLATFLGGELVYER